MLGLNQQEMPIEARKALRGRQTTRSQRLLRQERPARQAQPTPVEVIKPCAAGKQERTKHSSRFPCERTRFTSLKRLSGICTATWVQREAIWQAAKLTEFV